MATKIGLLHIDLRLNGAQSLKDKRSILKPLLTQLHRRFQASAAEVDHQDQWQRSRIAISLVSNDSKHIEQSFQSILAWLDKKHKEVTPIEESIEIMH